MPSPSASATPTSGGEEAPPEPKPPPPEQNAWVRPSAAETVGPQAGRKAPDAEEADAKRQDERPGEEEEESRAVEPAAEPVEAEIKQPAADVDKEAPHLGAPDLESVLRREALPATPVPQALGSRYPFPQGKSTSRGWLISIVVTAVTLVLLLGGLVVGRDAIIAAFPAAADLYSRVGLGGKSLGAGLEIQNVGSAREWDGPEEVLVVQGTIVNVADQPRDVPPIRVALFDADDEEVQSATVPPAAGALAPGETVRFEARIKAPADTARRIKVSFAPKDEPS